MIARLGAFSLHLRRFFSRSEWVIRLLRLSRSEGPAHRGLILVQIDGLSRRQLECALARGNMPFLKRLLAREHYTLHSMYSGIPSNTPAVQGEIFYGSRACTPAFSFRHRKSGKIFKMYETEAAQEVERCIEKDGPGLLRGGSSYSNIFTGGAGEAHFCAARIGSGILRAHPWAWPFLSILYADVLVRTAVLLAVEFALACVDCVRGTIAGKTFLMELQFIPLRVAICVLLRECVRMSASIDVARGLPIIHLNLLGYDEQAHRRGPTSRFAHWSLRGIDDAIRGLWNAAQHSPRRDYDLWVYSDHGQEETRPYKEKNAPTLARAVSDVFGKLDCAETARSDEGVQFARAEYLDFRRHLTEDREARNEPEAEVVIAAMGPLGHIYPSREVDLEEKETLGKALAQNAGIPLVLTAAGPGEAIAWTEEGRFMLPIDGPRVLGKDHPFLEEVSADLASLCHHRDAGTFVLCGWRKDRKMVSFPSEHGSHAGPGHEETHAFAVLSQDAPLEAAKPYLRPSDIREAAERLLGRSSKPLSKRPLTAGPTSLRVMTYNVHGCVGMDGRLSPERIARVIARHEADVIALQELDAGRERSGGMDQAALIARRLEMHFHFHPTVIGDGGKYGNAVLSRYPMHLVKMEALPRSREEAEPRGALWVSLDLGKTKVQFITAHLSIWPNERVRQADALAGPQWLLHPFCVGPVVLCGDLNALPGSPSYRKIGRVLRDTQLHLNEHRPHNTWLGRYPLSRIDHVFVGPHARVLSVRVPTTELDKCASDHLPLIVDLGFTEERTLNNAVRQRFSIRNPAGN